MIEEQRLEWQDVVFCVITVSVSGLEEVPVSVSVCSGCVTATLNLPTSPLLFLRAGPNQKISFLVFDFDPILMSTWLLAPLSGGRNANAVLLLSPPFLDTLATFLGSEIISLSL